MDEKDDLPKSVGQSETALLSPVRDWFEGNKANLRLSPKGLNYRTESQELILPFFEKEPDWEQFHHYYFPDGREVFEINLENSKNFVPKLKGKKKENDGKVVQTIMFVKNLTENRFDPLIVRYFPDDEYSSRDFDELNYLAIDEKWSGWIDLFSYDEHHLIGFRLDQGTKVSSRKFSVGNQEANSESRLNAKYAYQCEETTYDWYQITMSGDSFSVQQLDSTVSTECGWVDVGGGDPTGETNETGGGTTSTNYTLPTIPAPNLKIQLDETFRTNMKLMCILGKLQLTEFVKSMAIVTDSYSERNVILKVGKTVDPTANAETSDFYGANNIVITINSSKLNSSSLSLARTLLHEIIHAEIYAAVESRNGTPIDGNFEHNFNEYVELYFKQGDIGIHHNYMANKVVDRMAYVLEQIHPYLGKQEFLNDPNVINSFPKGLPDYFYKAIAWQGLKSTKMWLKDMSYTDREKYTYCQIRDRYLANDCK